MSSDKHLRLRVFAGPNGSGKSTLTSIIGGMFNMGVYVNADDLKISIVSKQRLDFSDFGIQVDKQEFDSGWLNSTYRKGDEAEYWEFENNGLCFYDLDKLDDYFVAFLADFIRQCLLGRRIRFSFETVMSNPSKLDLMQKAKERGYKVYLYFVSLSDPQLNVLRVRSRVSEGGHDVIEEKIVSRYDRTMDLLYKALMIADSAYIFDNSGSELKMIAKKERGILQALVEYVPSWYKLFVLDKIK